MMPSALPPRAAFTALLAGLALAAVGAGLSACHSELRFDDQSLDAHLPPAPGPDAADVSAEHEPAVCQEVRCGYETESCGASTCELECPPHAQCTGLCGPGCTTDCEEDSQCSLVTGNDARIRCEPSARCLLTLGNHGEGRCEGGSRCNIICLATCALLCDPGATCAFACSSNTPLAPFVAHAGCP